MPLWIHQEVMAILGLHSFLHRVSVMILPYCLRRVPLPGTDSAGDHPHVTVVGTAIEVLAETGVVDGTLAVTGVVIMTALHLHIVAAGIVVITVPLLRLSPPLQGGRNAGELM
jgi:hypothetical protein